MKVNVNRSVYIAKRNTDFAKWAKNIVMKNVFKAH